MTLTQRLALNQKLLDMGVKKASLIKEMNARLIHDELNEVFAGHPDLILLQNVAHGIDTRNWPAGVEGLKRVAETRRVPNSQHKITFKTQLMLQEMLA